MPSTTAHDFPLLGCTGAESQYCIPHIQSLDEVVEVIGLAEMKDTISIWRLKRDHISVDELPLRAYILGRVDRYGGSPCKSGVLQGRDVILVGTSSIEKASGRLEYVRQVPLSDFNATYELMGRYEPARRDAIRSFEQEGKLVPWSASPLKLKAAK